MVGDTVAVVGQQPESYGAGLASRNDEIYPDALAFSRQHHESIFQFCVVFSENGDVVYHHHYLRQIVETCLHVCPVSSYALIGEALLAPGHLRSQHLEEIAHSLFLRVESHATDMDRFLEDLESHIAAVYDIYVHFRRGISFYHLI